MAERNSSEFQVTVSYLESRESVSPPPYVENEQDARQLFWKSLQRRYDTNREPPSPWQHELHLARRFGIELKEHLVGYVLGPNKIKSPLGPISLQGGENIRSQLAGIFFEAKVTGYHSLGFSVAIQGLEKLVRIFDSNFDLFFMFLNAYIPIAFQAVFDDYDIEDRYGFKLEFPEAVQSEFQRTKPSRKSIGNIYKTASGDFRAAWYWTVANFSLLLPVILALVVLYVAFTVLAEERSLVQSRYEQLTAQEAVLFESCSQIAERTETLESVLIEKMIFDLNLPEEASSSETADGEEP